MLRPFVRSGAAAMLLVVAVVAASQLLPIAHAENPQTGETSTQLLSPEAKRDLESARSLSRTFARVAEVITPSVVNISSTRKVDTHRTLNESPFGNSPRDFFGNPFFERFFGGSAPREQLQRGQGTGFVVDAEGHILTNNHVVDGADEITVKLADDRTYEATVVGTDPKTDLAVLRIDADNLQPATLGDSDALEIGEWVIAAGNPFGLNSSITSGVVSAKGRAHVGLAEYEDFIQTDAAINPGNSGGPLVDLEGRVVGINTAIVTRSGGYMGIGFAIPVNMAQSIMHSLIDDGRVVRGWMGVLIQELNTDLAASFGYESTDGVLVGDVTANGPAERAGIESGDIVLEYDGKVVKSVDELRSLVAATAPGDKVDLEVFRHGKSRTIHMKIGELETQVATADDRPQSAQLGMTVRTLTPQIARQLQLEEGTRGVVVSDVDPFGAAARAGFAAKDVIVTVQDQQVEDVEGFRAALAKRDLDKGVRMSVLRGSTRRFVLVRVPSDPS